MNYYYTDKHVHVERENSYCFPEQPKFFVTFTVNTKIDCSHVTLSAALYFELSNEFFYSTSFSLCICLTVSLWLLFK